MLWWCRRQIQWWNRNSLWHIHSIHWCLGRNEDENDSVTVPMFDDVESARGGNQKWRWL
jgi:hypothetical protein